MRHRYKEFATSELSLTCGCGTEHCDCCGPQKASHLSSPTLERICEKAGCEFLHSVALMISYFRRPCNHTSNACERLAPDCRSGQLPAHNLTQSRVSLVASAAAKFLHFEQVYRCRRRHEYERVLFFRAARETACLGGE